MHWVIGAFILVTFIIIISISISIMIIAIIKLIVSVVVKNT